MNVHLIEKAFAELVGKPGIHHQLKIPKNNVAQYRWKLKRGKRITLDKQIRVLQKAGYRMEMFEYADKDMVEFARFILRAASSSKEMGAEYLLEKWKTKRAKP